MRKVVCAVFLLGLALLLTMGVLSAPTPADRASPSAPAREASARVTLQRSFGKMPLYFVENRGQLDPRVAYSVQGRDTAIYFTREGVTFSLIRAKEKESSPGKLSRASFGRGSPAGSAPLRRWNVKLDFLDANPNVEVLGSEKTPAVVSYFKGSREDWKTGLATYSSVLYRELWPGIDLVYSGTVNRLKYQFVIKPGADPERIRLAYRGASQVKLGREGALEVETPLGGFSDDRPYSYQEIGGSRVEVETEYFLSGRSGSRHAYGFRVGTYEKSRPLVIDPAVLVYAGFIGGSFSDEGRAIAVDASGNAYVTGNTPSDEATFPEAVGPDLTHNGANDAFVAKVNAAGTSLVYAGYIGGSNNDIGRGIAVDASGNAYVTGRTDSTEATFPETGGPDLTSNGGGSDAFVAKVNAAGTSLVYAGFIGGSGTDFGFGIAVDASGNAYVTGSTSSAEATFPETGGPDLTSNGGFDAFVAKVNAAGASLLYAGFIGGVGSDDGFGIAVDGSGNAYVTGVTSSDEATFPETGGPDLTSNGGLGDAFVAKVNAAGASLVYAGYIGGSNSDAGRAIAVDGSGNAYVTGETDSTEATFPETGGPDLTSNGSNDAFVAKVNAAGTSLLYAGFIGGASIDEGLGIAVDGSGNAYVTGVTLSDEATFPETGGPDLTSNGGFDAFVAKVNAAGTSLLYAGFIGGADAESGLGIAVDASGNAYVTGNTLSDEATFPETGGPDLTHNGAVGSFDAFVAKVSEVGKTTPTPTLTNTPVGVATATPTPTLTATVGVPTATPTPTSPPLPTSTPTLTPPTVPSGVDVPTLSFPMLLLLGLGLAATALFVMRRA